MAAAPLAAAYTAHAPALATMMSTAYAFIGDDAGRKTSGAALVRLADAGNVMTRPSAILALTAMDALQGSVAFAEFCVRRQAPAFAAGEPALKQRQAEHPAVCTADAAQQQPPRQRFVPQSKDDAHLSPGFTSEHAPVFETQVEQPRAAEELEQQKPPRQAEEAHVELAVQEVPPAARVVAEMTAPHMASDDAPAYTVAVLPGHASGAEEPAGQ